MGIYYDNKSMTFRLDTPNTSYMMRVLDGGYLMHQCWGKKVSEMTVPFLTEWYPAQYQNDLIEIGYRSFQLGELRQEFPGCDVTDFRTGAVKIANEDGTVATDFRYRSHDIITGKTVISGLPSTFAAEHEAETLVIRLYEAVSNIEALLWYTVFEKYDVITRHVTLINHSSSVRQIKSLYSCCVDFMPGEYDIIHFYGSWANERMKERLPVPNTVMNFCSTRGTSSHEHNPFVVLCDREATEDFGDTYGFNFVYSGSFSTVLEQGASSSPRVLMGLNPDNFSWTLNAGESFDSPEAVLVYSAEGLNGMSQTYHHFYKNHLISPKWTKKPRPILINNWEATYFDFNRDKLMELAKEAANLGIELFVLDDGWFGHRNHDNSSLGDWVVNEEKIGGSMQDLASDIHALGMQFGLWLEPEMVSPDSDLYRAHPDWCLHCTGRIRSTIRNQLVLDLSRDEVVQYIIDAVSAVLESCDIDYVKWDMNRSLTEVGSAVLPAHKQGEIRHRYMLGLYRVLDTITKRFPNILFESCASGGGRFDPGMLYYMPQVWTSDNTDAVHRLKIQYSTSYAYPGSAMSAHVSAVPNHQMHRDTPLQTRFHAALTGSFGYELDLCKLSDVEKEAIREQVSIYRELREVLVCGDFYRLRDPNKGNECAWMTVAGDQSKAIACYFRILSTMGEQNKYLKLKGLDPKRYYREEDSKMLYKGDTLMNIGFSIPRLDGDFQSYIIRLTAVE